MPGCAVEFFTKSHVFNEPARLIHGLSHKSSGWSKAVPKYSRHTSRRLVFSIKFSYAECASVCVPPI